MKRINLYIPENQYGWLTTQSEALGISAAEIVRRALDYWIKAKSHPFEMLRSEMPGYDPMGDPIPEKPLDQEFIERFARLERMVYFAMSPEARKEYQDEARAEFRKMFGYDLPGSQPERAT